MKSIKLPAQHYAARWASDAAPRPHAEINALGKRYVEKQDQDALLCLCQAFHPYLMKYLVMICRGHMPVIGVGANPLFISKDTKPFLQMFLPKGQPATRKNLLNVIRHLHLAFKGMDGEEIYDVLMEQLIAAINGYDPHYKAKVKKVIEVIDRELSESKWFSVTDVRRCLGFDCDKHLRLLVRRGFLQVVPGEEGESGAGFRRQVWPVPVEFTEGDGEIIGLAYYLQKWFRFNLQDWITQRARELEAKDGVYSLEDWNETRANYNNESPTVHNPLLEQVVSSDGDYQDAAGTRLDADVGDEEAPRPQPMTSGSRWV